MHTKYAGFVPENQWVNSNSVLLGPCLGSVQPIVNLVIWPNKIRQVNSHDPLPTLQVKGHQFD